MVTQSNFGETKMLMLNRQKNPPDLDRRDSKNVNFKSWFEICAGLPTCSQNKSNDTFLLIIHCMLLHSLDANKNLKSFSYFRLFAEQNIKICKNLIPTVCQPYLKSTPCSKLALVSRSGV